MNVQQKREDALLFFLNNILSHYKKKKINKLSEFAISKEILSSPDNVHIFHESKEKLFDCFEEISPLDKPDIFRRPMVSILRLLVIQLDNYSLDLYTHKKNNNNEFSQIYRIKNK
jgi:hypothetical protein